jgi:hypothetical protein
MIVKFGNEIRITHLDKTTWKKKGETFSLDQSLSDSIELLDIVNTGVEYQLQIIAVCKEK